MAAFLADIHWVVSCGYDSAFCFLTGLTQGLATVIGGQPALQLMHLKPCISSSCTRRLECHLMQLKGEILS